MKEKMFVGTTPCKNCPYRCDAPLQLWSIEEFTKLIEIDREAQKTKFTLMGNDEVFFERPEFNIDSI